MMIQKKATLHEKTVQKIAIGEIVKRRRQINKLARTPNSKVVKPKWSDNVSPLLVQWARDNKIHYTRIIVNSYTSITIKPKKD